MKNQITIGGKIGYLNLSTGRYKYVPIIGIDTARNVFKMREEHKHNNFGRSVSSFINEYEEKIDDVIKYLKTPSIDWKDGRPLLKYKGTNKLY